MDFQNSLAALYVRPRNHDPAIESTGTQERGIEDVRTVGCGDQDDTLVRLKPVHLDEQLVQGLLALVMSAAQTGATVASDGVDLVDEDNAGRVLLALNEKVPHPRRADPDEHFDEVGTRNREERNAGLARNGARQQGFAGSGGSDQKNPLGNSAAQASEALGVAQKLNYFLEFILGFVDARNVGKGNLVSILGKQLGATLSKRHGLAAADLHLMHEENPQCCQHQDRKPLNQRHHPPGVTLGGFGRDIHVFIAQRFDDVGIVGRVGLEVLVGGGLALYQVALDGDGPDLTLIDLV